MTDCLLVLKVLHSQKSSVFNANNDLEEMPQSGMQCGGKVIITGNFQIKKWTESRLGTLEAAQRQRFMEIQVPGVCSRKLLVQAYS